MALQDSLDFQVHGIGRLVFDCLQCRLVISKDMANLLTV